MRPDFWKTNLASVLMAVALASPLHAQSVKIAQGVLQGAADGRGRAEVFNDIPFAAPPVGSLRWRPPQPAAGWRGVRNATAFGPACPQILPMGDPGAVGAVLGPQKPFKQSEDCLNLNVTRPAGVTSASRLPVMLWIFGGGFWYGGNSQQTYNGAELVKRGVILVIPNYRLGALGFLAHPELSAEDAHGSSGNYGALDVVAALRWVKRNIASFGGDPNNVTIFGESAGGAMVGLLSGSPLTDGLFQRGISESGYLFGPIDRGEPSSRMAADDLPLDVAKQAGVSYLARLGVSSIAAARALPAEKLVAALLPAPGRPPISFRPVVDGWIFPKPSHALLYEGAYDRRPVIAGYNNDEGVLFTPEHVALQDYRAMVRRQWGAFADTILATYPASTDVQALKAMRDIQRDAGFGWPAWTWARGEHGAKVYLYNFDHRPPFAAGPRFAAIQAPHAVELPYVFGTLTSPQMAWSPDDRAISAAMIGYWTNFAKTGDPNGPGLPGWTPSNPAAVSSIHFGRSRPEMGEIDALPKLQALDGYFKMRLAQDDKE